MAPRAENKLVKVKARCVRCIGVAIWTRKGVLPVLYTHSRRKYCVKLMHFLSFFGSSKHDMNALFLVKLTHCLTSWGNLMIE